MRNFLLLFLLVATSQLSAQNKSNRGTEFWVGYGHNALFGNVNQTSNSQELVLYLGATQPATVTVTVNGTAYSQTYNIAANSVIQTAALPKAGINDARLTTEGLNTKGIHIVSDVPIVAYAHQYGFNSSGATMLMPVETYGYTYYSLNYTQESNVSPSYSWFYVIASEDNTSVEITPSVTTDGGKAAGVAFSVTLNKGEIYNVFGESLTNSFTGLDVTGSKIKSIAGTDGKCHPIAVFSGSSRITICGSSGDILQQQIFPSSAWGTQYLTYPTISTNDVTQPNTNYYRIAVRDPSTKVKLNGALLTGLINNFYYQFSSNNGDFIEADKPILVSQYVPSMNNCASYDGNGDPEMFFLSPLQQAVTDASFYSTDNQNILDNYVCIVVKTAGLTSLLIDGASIFSAVSTHPRNAAYSVVVQSLAGNQQHTITCDSAFTALTYGFGNVESYGYNAGTMINDLDIIPAIKNTFSTGTAPSVYACPNSPFNISLRMAYKATKMVWHFSQISNVTPGYDTTLINPAVFDSTVIDGRVYYGYKLPRNYVLSDTGTYNIPISVTAPEIDNCSNTLDFIYTIRVNSVPKPALFVNYSKCLQDTAQFNTNGINGFSITGILWRFDDGTFATISNPRKSFASFGPHTVQLTLVTSTGCIADTTAVINTYVKPTASFGIANLPACEGSTLSFSDTSFFGGTIARWYWDFGNGVVRNISTSAFQLATYPAAGIYTVKHLAQSTGTCASDTAKKVIQIFAKPIVKFGVTDGCLPDSIVKFRDSTKISDGQTLSYNWNFGDANASTSNPDTSTVQNPTHQYTVPGTYSVTLTVNTLNGCSSSYTKSVVVYAKPAANFGIVAPSQCITGNSFSFTSTSVVSPGTLSLLWSFGDGGTSTLANPTHSYVTAGTFNVKLVVTTNNGCKDSIIKTVIVNPKPTVIFSPNVPAQCQSGNSFAFTNNSTVSSGTMTYDWNFGDGGTSSIKNPVHSYAAAGTYIVRLIVTSDKGCIDSAKVTVTVYPKPVAGFTVNGITQCGTTSFVFTDTSKVASGTLTYLWSFGDGGTSAVKNPTHSYSVPGVYLVKMYITSANGCKDSASLSVTSLAQPVAGFLINNAAQCFQGNNFIFQNTSTNTAGTMTYAWTFGDGGTSTATNPTHSYASAATYTVTLTVNTSNGCTKTFSASVVVNPKPVANFAVPAAQCLGGNVFSFTNTSSITSGTITYQWLFGDGGTATTQNATHTYAASGSYIVKLIVTSAKGCIDSISKPVVVYTKPTASFTINSAAQCVVGNSFTFTNTSAAGAGGTLTYQWIFGNGNTSAAVSPVYTYPVAGTYIVKLITVESTGCRDTASQTIVVGPKPTANFNIVNASQCVNGNSFSFNNTSSITTGSITYQWSFGDGGTSIVQNPVHAYAAVGSYVVKLIVTSDKGCVDSISKTVTVNPKPLAAFTVNTASQCFSGNNFVFTNTSTVSSGTMSYSWSLGDGGTATTLNATRSYTTAGTYIVRLIVTTGNGCIDSVKQTITVNPKPSVSFTTNTTVQCAKGNSFSFTNTSSITTGTLSYQWSFGDGSTSVLQAPTHTYLAAGIYIVRLIATSDKGCVDSFKQTITVNPSPAAAFTVNSAAQCFAGNSFVFTNTSTVSSGTLSYLWSFGDGGTSTTQSATHSYTIAGTYIVTLKITATGGCVDSFKQTVTVNPKPFVSFSPGNTPQCFNGNSFTFTNASSVSSGTITYQWTFGDGGTSVLQSPTHSYAAGGIYIVRLIATSDKGCVDSFKQTITVNHSPTAAFTVNSATQCFAGNSFVFTNTSTVPFGTLSYLWSFGDGGTATTLNATRSYTTAGTYIVTLKVVGSGGCVDSFKQTVTVNPKPFVSFNPGNTPQCFNGNSFSFTNSSSVSSGTLSYQWSFGDGGTSVLQSPTHSYAAGGIYIVRLIATSDKGCVDSFKQTITVVPKPVAGFTANSLAQCFTGNSFTFTNTSTSSIGTPSYQWSFGDGATATTVNATHIYSTPGVYVVKLMVIAGIGCKDSMMRTITVNPGASVAFSINDSIQCLKANNFIFTNSSSISSGSVSHSWTFGDGAVSTAVSPSHTYTAPGIFTVKLVLTSDKGCKDSLTKQVVVNPMPVANFTINNTPQCLSGNSFSFTNTSTLSAGTMQYQWSFGDGNTATSLSPSHTYTTAGTYIVKLVVTTDKGCKDSTSRTVVVNPQSTAAFNISNPSQCVNGNNFVFTNTSVVSGAVSYQWTFGDGGNSTLQSPSYTYTAAGTYPVKLVITTANGCKDSVTQSVTVYAKPTPAFTISNAVQCLRGNSFSFVNGSTISAGTITYSWSFGDGATATIANPIHTYAATGTYNVLLVAISNNGCKDSVSQTVTVNPMPVAAFSINNQSQCLRGNSFVFNNTSSITAGTITYDWSFGDGGTSTNASPSYSYTVAGNYQVRLIVTSGNGCKDTLTKSVTVYPKPAANFTINNTSACLRGNSFIFADISTAVAPASYQWTFGDGNSSTLQNPSHSYLTRGVFTVQLIVTSANGCVDTMSKPVTVYPTPTAAFSINTTNQCFTGNSFVFANNSTIAAGSFSSKWDFDDGTTSGSISPTHVYTTAGTYNVKLIVTSANGCKDSIVKPVTVYPKATAAFAVNSLNQCFRNNQFTFTNNSVIPATATYQWSFGDGNTASVASPVYSYAAPGTYTVRLIVTTNLGCIDSLSQQVVVYAQPKALFAVNVSTQCLSGNSFVFTNNSSISAGTYTSSWSFGDATSSSQANPSHSYLAPGTYIVKLITVSDNGCIDSTKQTVVVNPQPAAAFNINAPNQCLNGNSYVFSNNSSSNGTPVYAWTFGDGGTSSAASPSYVYTASGNYTVKLIVISGNGCKDSIAKPVIVYAKPRALFGINGNAQCLNGNSFTFANSSFVSSGSFSSSWNFGDGTIVSAISPTHIYTTAGTYQVKLVITTNNGCKDSLTLPVTVYAKPTVAFNINDSAQCLAGNTFSFNNSSLSVGASLYNWSFGDGTVSLVQSPVHTYAAAGTYSVKLVVTSANGCKDSISKTLVVYPKPAVAFAANNAAQCLERNSFTFTNNTSLSAGTFTSLWSFGDGSNAASLNASHVYAASGTYVVKLVITTSDGCKDSLVQHVTVHPTPAAKFAVNDSTQCPVGNNFIFTNGSVYAGIGTFQWTFGDATNATTTSPTHTYANPGTYNVQMVVVSGTGCRDSITRKMVVYPKVTAGFSINRVAQCLRGNTFRYSNASTISPGGALSAMVWNFGDGKTDTLFSTSHSYTSAAGFRVKLTATSSDGCTDTISKPIAVYPMPVALFNINLAAQCFRGNNMVLSNASTGAASSQWSFGDGGLSNAVSPSHQYSSSGTYPVQLIATTTLGCADTLAKTITIYPQASAGFTIAANGDCINSNSFAFSNTSTLTAGTFSNAWSFGDGKTDTANSPVHSYTTAATFTVRLIATSDKGCADTAIRSLTVKPKPVVAFTVNKANQCLDANAFVFTNNSTGVSPVTQLWTMGEGGTATAKDTTYTYAAAGTYNVQLLVMANGCSDSLTKPMVVYPKPVAGFAVNNDIQCLIGNNYIFTNSATLSSGTMQYNYAFGDAGSSNLAAPVHSYATANSYTIKQTVTSDFGCIDSVKKVVQVLVNPRAAFTVNNSNQCFSINNFVFTNTSIAPSGTTYTWNFGNGSSSSAASPSVAYSTAAAYKVTLYLTATSGCKSDTATTSVSVLPDPVVNAGPDLAVLQGRTIAINALVSNGLTFRWSPGTYLSSTDVQSPLTTPSQSIGYRLEATGQGGCVGYDSVYVKVLQPLNIPNVFSPNGDGVNDTWVIRYLNDFPGCTVEVFNRYGAPVFTSNGYRKPWDGTYNGNNLPVGTYYYIINPKNGLDKLTGNVTILR